MKLYFYFAPGFSSFYSTEEEGVKIIARLNEERDALNKRHLNFERYEIKPKTCEEFFAEKPTEESKTDTKGFEFVSFGTLE